MAAIATSGLDRVARRRAARTLLGQYALLGLTLVVIFALIYPTAWILIASFHTPETMFAARGWVFTIDNYVHLLGPGFARAIFNSLFLCATSVVLSTVVAVVAAYVFSRLRFRGKRPLFDPPPRRGDHVGSRVERDDPQTASYKFLSRLAGAATNFEDRIGGRQIGELHQIVVQGLRIAGAGLIVEFGDFVEGEPLLHGPRLIDLDDLELQPIDFRDRLSRQCSHLPFVQSGRQGT